MAEREMKMPKKKISKDTEEENGIMPSQRQRPESGRYLLQIDRQPKSSFKHLTTLTRCLCGRRLSPARRGHVARRRQSAADTCNLNFGSE